MIGRILDYGSSPTAKLRIQKIAKADNIAIEVSNCFTLERSIEGEKPTRSKGEKSG
jgi:hypothetical protein